MKKWKRIGLMLSFLLFIFGYGITSNAKEITKEIELELPQDYVQCRFTAFSEEGEPYSYQLISPQGKTYFLSLNKEGIYECSVKNVKQGTWILKVSQTIEDDAEEVGIGRVTVNVKSEMESSKILDNQLKIAKEIANLKLYFKDDDLVAEWDDETCGNINIKVYDTKNYQIIKDETVKEQSFFCAIPSEIEEITVEIVPATSINIAGAGETYTLKADNHPQATIRFENKEYTNAENIVAVAQLSNPYQIRTEVNGVLVDETEELKEGTHEIDIPIKEGLNEIKVYVVDEKGNMRSYPCETILDQTPPVLMLASNEDGKKTYENTIVLSGTVEEYSKLIFQNKEVEVEWDGRFSVEGTLREGENKVVLTAYDEAGNTAEYVANVTMLVKEEIPWILIIGIFLLCFVVLIFVVMIVRKKKSYPKKMKKEVKQQRKLPLSKPIRIQLLLLGSIALMLILLFNCVIQISIVRSPSMAPNIQTGDFIVTNRLAYVIRTPQRGEIINFTIPEEKGKTLVKRIIGMPGDIVSFIDGYVFINGIICVEEYLPQDTETNERETFTVPENSYFVLGDKRENSYDSRYWEDPYIGIEEIKGRVLFQTSILKKIVDIF